MGVPSCQNWPNLKSALYSTKANAPTRCASFGTCALLVLEDTPHMLALESGQRPCCSPAGQSLRSTVPQTLSQPDEPQGWLDMLAFSHLPTPTCPFRLTGCDHFFIAVPQPALPAHSMNCVCTYQFAELIRLAYFKSGPYSKVVLSWMQSHST